MDASIDHLMTDQPGMMPAIGLDGPMVGAKRTPDCADDFANSKRQCVEGSDSPTAVAPGILPRGSAGLPAMPDVMGMEPAMDSDADSSFYLQGLQGDLNHPDDALDVMDTDLTDIVEEGDMDCEGEGEIKGGGSSRGENTGRWGEEEHQLFLQGLELFGKGWKKIAGLIKTRTVVQIRTHAQKYFQKLAKARRDCDPSKFHLDPRHRAALAGVRKRGLARRRSDGSFMSVAPSLQPYLKMPDVGGSLEAGLYKFLSPALVDGKAPCEYQRPPPDLTEVLTSSKTSKGSKAKNGPGSGASSMNVESQGRQQAPQTTKVNLAQAPAGSLTERLSRSSSAAAETEAHTFAMGSAGTDGTTTDGAEASLEISSAAGAAGEAVEGKVKEGPPEWYHRGADVQVLLEEAERIDWLADNGGTAIKIECEPVSSNGDCAAASSASADGSSDGTKGKAKQSNKAASASGAKAKGGAKATKSQKVTKKTKQVQQAKAGRVGKAAPVKSGQDTPARLSSMLFNSPSADAMNGITNMNHMGIAAPVADVDDALIFEHGGFAVDGLEFDGNSDFF